MNIQLTKVTIPALIKELQRQEDLVEDVDLLDDISWSITRLEERPKGTKLVHINNLSKVPAALKVEEGYWTINGFAYYLAVPR